MHDVVAALAVAADGDVLGEHRHAGRRRAGLLAPGPGVHVLVVQASRRCGRAGEPVEHHVGEHVVAVDGVLGQLRGGVGPLLELLHDPGAMEIETTWPIWPSPMNCVLHTWYQYASIA